MSIELDVDSVAVIGSFKQGEERDKTERRVEQAVLVALEPVERVIPKIDLISQKQGVLWNCIGVVKEADGGMIYKYKLKDEYDCVKNPQNDNLVSSKLLEIFPATEPSDIHNLAFSDELKALGFMAIRDKSGAYLHLPDPKTIEMRYAKLREQHPEYPPLRITISHGVAEDDSFSRAYLHYDILYSDGIEFLHDSITHAANVLKMMMESPAAYLKEKGRIAQSIEGHLNQIAKTEDNVDKVDKESLFKQINTLLGAAVDIIWAAPTIEDLMEISIDQIDLDVLIIWNDSDYQQFWKREYGTQINAVKALCLWKPLDPYYRTITSLH